MPSARPAVTRSVTAGSPAISARVSAWVTMAAAPRPGPRQRGEGRRGSRAAAGGADLPHRATKAVFRAERPVRLAFRPGPAASTLDSARRVKSAVPGRRQVPCRRQAVAGVALA